MTMKVYLIKVHAMIDDLKALGEVIKDLEIIDFISNGLGPDFCPIICAARSQRKIEIY